MDPRSKSRVAEFLTIKEAAEVIRVEYKTLYRMIVRGEGPRHHVLRAGINRRIMRIKRTELDSWLEKHINEVTKCTA